MQAVHKLVFSFTTYATLFVLVLPFINSSQDKMTTDQGNNLHKASPELLFEITLHGFLLWASMGFLMPLGILIIRISHREECGRRLKILFQMHFILQILSVLMVTAGAVMSIINFNNSFNNNHQRIGLALYVMVWLQAIIGFLRPQRGSNTRSVWFSLHWILGTTQSLLGIINILTGLQAYHEKTSRSIKVWTLLFTCEVALVIFIYLVQDKWAYILKQGVILGNYSVEPLRPTQMISLPNKQFESRSERC